MNSVLCKELVRRIEVYFPQNGPAKSGKAFCSFEDDADLVVVTILGAKNLSPRQIHGLHRIVVNEITRLQDGLTPKLSLVFV